VEASFEAAACLEREHRHGDRMSRRACLTQDTPGRRWADRALRKTGPLDVGVGAAAGELRVVAGSQGE